MMVTILFSKSNRRVIKTDKKNVDLKMNTITNKKKYFSPEKSTFLWRNKNKTTKPVSKYFK